MSADAVRRLFHYNQWAWLRVWPSLEELSDPAYKAERPFFWGSLHGLAVHCAFAEDVWLRRIHGESPTAMWDPATFPTVHQLHRQWETGNRRWQTYLASLLDGDLDRPVTYANTQGESHTLQLGDILRHVANHATEHRSQMTPVLHQLGVATPPLDMILFCREIGP